MSRSAPGQDGAAGRVVMAGLHLLFVLLLLIATVRALLLTERDALILALSTVLALVYAAGIPLGRATRRSPGAGRGPAYVWLGALVTVWCGLVLLSAEYSWVAFALYLLALHLVRGPARYVVVAGLAAAVVLAQLGGAGGVADMNPGQVIGPVIGALVAIGAVLGFERVAAESEERRRLLAELLAAEDDLLAVSEELAATQREAGAAAERARLARDIHDTLAQGFSSIVLLSRAGLNSSGSTQETLRQIEATAAENLGEARRVVHALTPAELQEAPLPGALERLLRRFQEQTGVQAELVIDGAPRALPTTHDVALLRLAQGALANVRQHAGAGRVRLTLSFLPDGTALDVVDDGRGFDLAEVTARRASPTGSSGGAAGGAPRGYAGDAALRGGFGLRAMRERLADVGGMLTVESEPGDGTAVSAFVPGGEPPPENGDER